MLFQGNVTYTCDPEYFIGAFATLIREFTRTCLFDVSFFQIDVVCLPRPCGAPPLAHSASRSNIAVVYRKSVTYTCDLGYTINPRDVSSTTSSLSSKETGFETVRLSLAVPWCAKSQNFQNAQPSTVTVGCLEEVFRFQWISLGARIKYTCQAGFTTAGETSGGT